jgi:flagellar FliL protein
VAEDKNSSGDDVKKKLPIVPILIGVLVVLVVAVGAVFATLMLTGGFSDEALESELAEIESAATGAQSSAGLDDGTDAAPPIEPQLLVTPVPPRLATLYYEMTRPLTANLTGSRRVMQVTIAIMTHYDQLVVDNIVKHEMAIRSALLTVLSNTPEANLERPDFRLELGEEMRIGINSVLEQFENFGGVESVYFTEFLIQ